MWALKLFSVPTRCWSNPPLNFPPTTHRCTLRILPFDLFSPSQILLLFHAARVFKGPRYFCQLLQDKVTQLPSYQSVAGLIARSSPRSVKSHDSYNKPCKAKPPPFRDFALGPFSYPGTGRRAVFETCNDRPWHSPHFHLSLPPHNSSGTWITNCVGEYIRTLCLH